MEPSQTYTTVKWEEPLVATAMGSKRVHIRVGEDRREKWHDHATDDFGDKYGSVSALIRDAVETQMDIDKGNLSAGGGGGSGASETVEANGRIDDIKTGVEDNASALEDIQNRLAELHNDVVSGGMPEPELVFSDVYGAIPTVEDSFADADETAVAREFGATAGEIADDVDMSEAEVSRALIQLHYEYDDVAMLMTREFNQPRYWVEA